MKKPLGSGHTAPGRRAPGRGRGDQTFDTTCWTAFAYVRRAVLPLVLALAISVVLDLVVEAVIFFFMLRFHVSTGHSDTVLTDRGVVTVAVVAAKVAVLLYVVPWFSAIVRDSASTPPLAAV